MFYERVDKVRSELEKRFLEDCVTVGLIVEPDYLIGPIHADFALPARRIAIEIDSKEYHSTPESQLEDKRRNEIYASNGWSVVRLWGEAVMKNGEDIAYQIKRGKYDEESLVYVYDYKESNEQV